MKRSPKPSYNAPAVTKAVELFELLCQSPQPLGVSEIGSALKTNPNMVFRLLTTLHRAGWIARENPGPKYHVTLRPYHYASLPVSRMSVKQAVVKPVSELWERTHEACYVGILDGDKVLYINTHDSIQGSVRIALESGARYSLHVAAPGKVLLAHNEPLFRQLARRGFERFTQQTICDPEALRSELDRIRQNGYAVDREEGGNGLLCLAAPVFNSTGDVVASVGISVLTINYNVQEMLDRFLAPVLEAGSEISRKMGYLPGQMSALPVGDAA